VNEFATPRKTEIQDGGIDFEDEDLIQREDMVVTVSPCRLHQARAALDLPGAASRRQGPLRHGDARRGFRHPSVRREHPYAGAVLLVARHRLQG
jgi:DNA gyrase/topoisomerase IV subunit A